MRSFSPPCEQDSSAVYSHLCFHISLGFWGVVGGGWSPGGGGGGGVLWGWCGGLCVGGRGWGGGGGWGGKKKPQKKKFLFFWGCVFCFLFLFVFVVFWSKNPPPTTNQTIKPHTTPVGKELFLPSQREASVPLWSFPPSVSPFPEIAVIKKDPFLGGPVWAVSQYPLPSYMSIPLLCALLLKRVDWCPHQSRRKTGLTSCPPFAEVTSSP